MMNFSKIKPITMRAPVFTTCAHFYVNLSLSLSTTLDHKARCQRLPGRQADSVGLLDRQQDSGHSSEVSKY